MRIVKIRHPPEPDSEAYLTKLVMDAAATLGWLGFHDHDSRRAEAGFPDWTLVRISRPGRPYLVFAELKGLGKRTKKERAEAQAKWLRLLDNPAAGVVARLWTLDDWDAGRIEEVLR